MISINDAIKSLQSADLIKPDGEPAMATSGELILLLEELKRRQDEDILRPVSEWHEDYGECLFYIVPIQEPPTVTSPISSDWDDRYTHFRKLPEAQEP